MKKESICVSVDSHSRMGVVTPIYPSTAFQYVDEGDQYYPRYFNTPNQDAIVAKLAKLEGAEDGVVFGSGMSAITTTMLSVLGPGDHVVCLEGLYGGTHKLVTTEFSRLGIEVSFAAASIGDFEAAIGPNTKAIYIESPTNPTMTIIELAGIAELAQKSNCVSIIDNTFASPICQTPIAHGIDLVVHSGTKYIGGHSDLACGAVLGSTTWIEKIRGQAKLYGGSLNALTCHLIERSLKTLAVRVQRQCENAMTLASALEKKPKIPKVFYPGLSNDPFHEIASRQMSRFGGMLSFELEDPALVKPFLENLKVITPALSLGGVESTVCVPALTSHRDVDRAELKRVGISDALVRFSVGIEHVDDLLDDLENALHVVGSPALSSG